MKAESVFDPISEQACVAARRRLAIEQDTPAKWAVRNGFGAKTVYAVLSGKRRAIRGDSLQIAILLGLRPDPNPLAAKQNVPSYPAGRTIAGGRPIDPCDRPSLLQVGEAAR